MSVGQFNTGRDVSVDVVGPNGPITLTLITTFDSKQKTKDVESSGLDGVTRQEYIPDGWDVEVSIDRADRNADEIITILESLYYAGQRMTKGSITQTIREVDGSISQWRFEPLSFKLADAGSWQKDAKVPVKLTGFASFRKKVA